MHVKRGFLRRPAAVAGKRAMRRVPVVCRASARHTVRSTGVRRHAHAVLRGRAFMLGGSPRGLVMAGHSLLGGRKRTVTMVGLRAPSCPSIVSRRTAASILGFGILPYDTSNDPRSCWRRRSGP